MSSSEIGLQKSKQKNLYPPSGTFP